MSLQLLISNHPEILFLIFYSNIMFIIILTILFFKINQTNHHVYDVNHYFNSPNNLSISFSINTLLHVISRFFTLNTKHLSLPISIYNQPLFIHFSINTSLLSLHIIISFPSIIPFSYTTPLILSTFLNQSCLLSIYL